LDVRTTREFELGHVPGAFNIPVQCADGDTLVSNPEFLGVVQSVFAPETALIVGCNASARAERACAMLQEAGYGSLLRLRDGWQGRRDAFGRLIPGWGRLGLPIELTDGGERSYLHLRQRVPSR
jgi:rhodanese-related sulfurtransferase